MNNDITMFLSNTMIILIIGVIYYLYYIKITDYKSSLEPFISKNEKLLKMKNKDLYEKKKILLTGILIGIVLVIIINLFKIQNNDVSSNDIKIPQDIYIDNFEN